MGHSGVAGPFCLQFFSSRGTPSSKLNAYLRLGLQPGLLHLLYQSQPVIGGHGNKATGNLDDVKPYFLALPDITLHRILALPEHMFEKASGRDEDIMFMTQLCDFQKSATRHQREGTSSKLQRIHIAAHRIDDVLKRAPAHRCVVRPSDFRDPLGPGLSLALIHSQERKSTFVRNLNGCHIVELLLK
jgi:hypothetical protein